MSVGAAVAPGKAKETSSDAELITECLRGREAAWSALIAKYKNLIFSIPIRSGFSQEEAADIFQAVCLDVFCELANLREPQALAGWLIKVTRNKCFHKRKENERFVSTDEAELEQAITPDVLENGIHEIKKDQSLRDAIKELTPRCRLLVEKLFFELPARSYQEVAEDLGLAIGSIGIIRKRCLKCLRGRLEELGVS